MHKPLFIWAAMSPLNIESRLVTLDDFPFTGLSTTRRIRVLLPRSYQQSDAHYPVIYFHDGQNAFFDKDAKYGTSWRIQDELDRIYQADPYKEWIVVAIDNSPTHDFNGRFNEYSPWKMDPDFKLPGRDAGIYELGGLGDLYADFVANDVRQHIDREFRTLTAREHRFVMGSSMGGLISAYIAMRYNSVFGSAGVFSPAFWFNKPKFLAWLSGVQLDLPLQLYMDVGTNETSDESRDDFNQIYVDDAKQVARVLTHMDNVGVRFEVCEDAIHNERDWQKRVPNFIQHCS